MEEKTPAPKHIKNSEKFGTLIRERWPEYVLEVIVIIFSISISFALDEWKDTQRRRELEQLYLKELAQDITSDMNQLKEVIAETRLVIQRTESLSKLGPRDTVPPYDQFVEDVRFIFKRPRFVARDATFSDLKSTGNMQVIRNFSLKNALFDYYSDYAGAVQVEAAELEMANSVLAPFIMKRISLSEGRKNGQKILPEAMFQEIEFQNVVLIRQTTRQELLEDYEDILAEARQIIALLEAQSEGN